MVLLTLLHVVAAFAAVFAFGLVVTILRQFPWVYLVGVSVTAMFPNFATTRPLAGAGGISVYFLDMLIAVGFAGALVRLGTLGRNVRGTVAAAVVLVFTAVWLWRGYSWYGQTAVNQARPFLAMLAITAFCLSLDQSEWKPKLERWLVLTGAALSVLAVYNAAKHGIGSADSYLSTGSSALVAVTGRILTAGQAVIVAAAALTLITRWAERPSKRGALSWLWLLVVVLAAQHRTVWAAFAVAVLAFVLTGRGGALARVGLALAGAVIFVSPLLLTHAAEGVQGKITHSFNIAGGQQSTFTARQQGWREIVDESRQDGPSVVIFGNRFGRPYTTLDPSGIFSKIPHNWYLSVFAKTGLVGLAAWLWLTGLTLFRRGEAKAERLLRSALGALLAVYLIAYAFDPQEAPLLALLLSASRPKAPDVTDGEDTGAGRGDVIHQRREVGLEVVGA